MSLHESRCRVIKNFFFSLSFVGSFCCGFLVPFALPLWFLSFAFASPSEAIPLGLAVFLGAMVLPSRPLSGKSSFRRLVRLSVTCSLRGFLTLARDLRLSLGYKCTPLSLSLVFEFLQIFLSLSLVPLFRLRFFLALPFLLSTR